MKQATSIILASLCWFAAIACISSCTSKKPSSSTTVRCCVLGNLQSIDPRIAIGYRQQPVIAKLFEGLMRVGKDGTPQLALAEAISISEDKKTYTFTLCPSKWSNGSPVTAHDFEYAWKSIISQKVPSKLASAFFDIKNARKAFRKMCALDEVGIRVLDDLKLQVELEHPAPYFLEWLANPLYSPIYQLCLKEKATMDEVPEQNFICNGPYRLVKKTLSQQVNLEKNPNYRHAAHEFPEKIQFIVLEDPNTAYNLFLKGELDWIGDPTGGAIPLELGITSLPKNFYINSSKIVLDRLICNVHLKHLSSAKIRNSFARAINRSEIISALSQSREFPSFSILPAKDSFLDSRPFDDHDTASAQELFLEGLAELGYTQETFPPITISYHSEPDARIICEIIAQQLHTTLGISIYTQPVERRQQITNIIQNRFELGYNRWLSYLNDPIYNIDSFNAIGGGFFKNGWKNQTYSDLVEASNEECDPQKRNELLKSAEKVLMEEMPVLPILETPFFYGKSEKIDSSFFD